ncbi:MAG: CAP domain-containing protein [Phycisphaerae bacterium]|nr:CAP domain-containing protein [Phycisphaerae bacterium]
MQQMTNHTSQARLRNAHLARGSSVVGVRFRRVAVLWFITLGLLSGCGAHNYAQPPRACATPSQADLLGEQLFRLINMERTLADLDPLTWDDDLTGVAQGYACRMIEGEFFGHTDPAAKSGPGLRLTTAGYSYKVMGENLAMGQTTAAEVLADWLASPSHRDNIMSSEWTHIGLGVRGDESDTLYWVIEFAEPA